MEKEFELVKVPPTEARDDLYECFVNNMIYKLCAHYYSYLPVC